MSAIARPVLAAALVGAVVALAVSLLLPETYRASGVVVLTREGRAPGDDPTLAPAAAAAADLLRSRAVAESVVANLRLDASASELLDRVSVEVGVRSSLLRLSVEADTPEEARRAAQELAEVFTVLYNTRFGSTANAAIWEAPRAGSEPVSPRTWRNAVVGLLVGAGLGALAAAAVRRRRASATPVVDGAATWSIADLEQAVAADGVGQDADDRPFYLAALREYADARGRLHPAFDALIREVFGEKLPRRPA